LYSLLCMAGASTSVCKRASSVCILFVNICEVSCASILISDLTSCRAISTILWEVKVEYWYEKSAIPTTTATIIASIKYWFCCYAIFLREDTFFTYLIDIPINNFYEHYTLLPICFKSFSFVICLLINKGSVMTKICNNIP
jgi:hypothetical protein